MSAVMRPVAEDWKNDAMERKSSGVSGRFWW